MDLSKIRLTIRPGWEPHSGTLVEIDGRMLPQLVDVHFQHQVGKIPTITAEMNVMYGEPFEFTVDAAVTVNIVAAPGAMIVVAVDSDGIRTYKALAVPGTELGWQGICAMLNRLEARRMQLEQEWGAIKAACGHPKLPRREIGEEYADTCSDCGWVHYCYAAD